MKLGMVGLGRMGANMTERLRKDGHEVETYARTAPERTTGSLVELASKLDQPRIVWLMIPAGTPTENAFQTLLPLLEDGDVVVDGGNSNFRDSQRRAAEAKRKGVYFLDTGVSGGIWGLTEGYCIMVGGEAAAFEQAEPIFKSLAPEDGYAHVGPSGAGRWTVFEAINESVPAGVIALSLFARFASRQDESFAAKVNAALRNQFGGHAVKAAQ